MAGRAACHRRADARQRRRRRRWVAPVLLIAAFADSWVWGEGSVDLRVNFGGSIDGYLADMGDVYGHRESPDEDGGHEYGWSCDMTAEERDRDQAGSRLSTFVGSHDPASVSSCCMSPLAHSARATPASLALNRFLSAGVHG